MNEEERTWESQLWTEHKRADKAYANTFLQTTRVYKTVQDCQSRRVRKLTNTKRKKSYENKTLEAHSREAELTIADFQIQRSLGRGQFAIVHRAVELSTGYEVALKKLEKDYMMKKSMEKQTTNEIRIHLAIEHPNIICLYGFFHDEGTVYMILESANQTVYDIMSKRKPKRFDERTAARYIRDVVRALRHCHARGIIHRDVKPENLLVDNNGRIKLADFGLATRLEQQKEDMSCGTLDFLSPEICSGDPYSFHVDIWALGAVLYEMLVGKPAFEVQIENCKENRKLTKECIKKGKFSFPNDVPISDIAKDLVCGLLQLNPNDRTPLACVLNHPWLLHHCEEDA